MNRHMDSSPQANCHKTHYRNLATLNLIESVWGDYETKTNDGSCIIYVAEKAQLRTNMHGTERTSWAILVNIQARCIICDTMSFNDTHVY